MKWTSVEALAAYPGHFMVLTIIVFGYKFQARLSWQHSRCGADHTLLYPNSQLQAEQSWQQTSTTPACAVLPVEWVWIVQCVTKKKMPSFRMLFQNYVRRTVMLQIGRCPQITWRLLPRNERLHLRSGRLLALQFWKFWVFLRSSRAAFESWAPFVVEIWRSSGRGMKTTVSFFKDMYCASDPCWTCNILLSATT